jgi:hypothetical protein
MYDDKVLNDAIYSDLLKQAKSLRGAQEREPEGMDDYLSGKNRVRVASMDALYNFLRLSEDTLVHKSEKDLWRVSENNNGEVIIERLFDPDTKEPLRV